jgi:ASC-1-like (ASCH) protein
MSKQHHYLKTINPYFRDVESGKKTFEVRFNDRNFKVFDVLHLQEFSPPNDFSGREIDFEVTYVLDSSEFCKNGFVVLGIKEICRNY